MEGSTQQDWVDKEFYDGDREVKDAPKAVEVKDKGSDDDTSSNQEAADSQPPAPDQEFPAKDLEQEEEKKEDDLEELPILQHVIYDVSFQILLTDSFKQLAQAQEYKNKGNQIIKDQGDILEAVRQYQMACNVCPPEEKEELAIYHNNLGIAYNKLDKPLQAKGEFTKAIELNPKYAKPLWHRLHIFKTETEYDKALEDANKILEIDPDFNSAQLKLKIIPELEKLQKEKFEKMKDEVVGNLKKLGNSVLGYFGMSIDNFKMQQNPDGTYNINY